MTRQSRKVDQVGKEVCQVEQKTCQVEKKVDKEIGPCRAEGVPGREEF